MLENILLEILLLQGYEIIVLYYPYKKADRSPQNFFLE